MIDIDLVILVNLCTVMSHPDNSNGCFSGSEFCMPGISYYSDQKSYFCILSYQIIT